MTKRIQSEPLSILMFEAKGALDSDKKIIPDKVQLMKKGIFSYWEKDDTVITAETFKSFVRNFENNTRGVDLAVDYGHMAYSEAAGWIKKISLDSDEKELYAEIEWTPRAKKLLEEKEYRYISAEYTMDYSDNEGAGKFGPCLLGAGLTNRPFLKKMSPLTEFNEENMEKKMDTEKKLAEMKSLIDGITKKLDETSLKLDETNSILKQREDEISNLKNKNKIDEKEVKFNELLLKGMAVEAQRQAYMEGDVATFSQLNYTNVLNFSQKGHSMEHIHQNKKEVMKMSAEEAEEALLEKAKAIYAERKNQGFTFSSAVSEVLRTNFELNKKYLEKFN